MEWAKIDTGFLGNKKMVAAGPEGKLLHLAAILWCKQHEEDGIVPAAIVPQLAATAPAKPRTAARLVEVGAWIEHPDHYELDGWLDWNEPAQKVRERREADRERKRQSRERPAGVRADTGRTPGGVQAASARRGRGEEEKNRDNPPNPPALTPVNDEQNSSSEDPRVAQALAIVAARRVTDGRSRTPRYLAKITENMRGDEGLDIDAARLCADFPTAPASLIAQRLEGDPCPNLAHYRAESA